jgi:nicotinamide phosphoribosyltransferase
MKAMLVVRPDSGDPIECIVEGLKIFEEKFGCTINKKGYKVLNKIRMIQGDGINEVDIENILKAVLEAGFSATNVGFGMGGGLLQKNIDRDTQKMAFKCSWAIVNGEEVFVYKDPVTDKGKKSKKGKLKLVVIKDNQVRTVPESTGGIDLLQLFYENGKLFNLTNFETIRKNVTEHVYDQYTGWIDKDCY